MHILLITPIIPYPLSEGGKVSQYALIDYLRKSNKLTLVVVASSISELNNIEQLKVKWPDVDVETVQLANKSELTHRNIIKNNIKNWLKKQLNWDKKYLQQINRSEFDDTNFTNYAATKSRLLIEQLDKIISKQHYDLIQVDFMNFIDLVYMLPSDIKKIFVQHEIRYAKLESSLATSSCGAFEKYVIQSIKKTEINHYKQYDGVLVFSEIDKQKLEEDNDLKGRVYNSPFPVLDDNFVKPRRENEKVNKLVFIGGDAHFPNKDALIWYNNEISPLLNKSLNIELHVIGNWSSETIKQFGNNGNIRFVGYVEDIISYCENSIMVVPVRIGSGIRTKILYAMAQGVPIVSASIGCEGIAVAHGKSIMIADTAAEFAKSISELVNNSNFRLNISLNAYNIAVGLYSQDSAGSLRNRIYKDILDKK